MARALRVEYSGAGCHLMSRGDHGKAIYLDETFKQRLLDLIRGKGSAGEADSHGNAKY